MKVEVAVLGFPYLIGFMVSVDVKHNERRRLMLSALSSMFGYQDCESNTHTHTHTHTHTPSRHRFPASSSKLGQNWLRH